MLYSFIQLVEPSVYEINMLADHNQITDMRYHIKFLEENRFFCLMLNIIITISFSHEIEQICAATSQWGGSVRSRLDHT